MEDYVIVLSIALIGVFALIGMKMFKPNQAKTKVTTRKDKAETTLDRVNEDTIERLSDQLKKEAGRANRLQALKDKSEDNEELIEESDVKYVTFQEIQALVDTKYPKFSKLLPLVEKQVMDATKGLTMEQILGYVKQFTQDKGSEIPLDAQPAKFNKDWA